MSVFSSRHQSPTTIVIIYFLIITIIIVNLIRSKSQADYTISPRQSSLLTHKNILLKNLCHNRQQRKEEKPKADNAFWSFLVPGARKKHLYSFRLSTFFIIHHGIQALTCWPTDSRTEKHATYINFLGVKAKKKIKWKNKRQVKTHNVFVYFFFFSLPGKSRLCVDKQTKRH